MSPKQTSSLLDELCVDLGFCLPPAAIADIIEKPALEVETFADAVIRAEGLDPEKDISRHLYRQVRTVVQRHFKAAEEP